jgi:hypothetical protein
MIRWRRFQHDTTQYFQTQCEKIVPAHQKNYDNSIFATTTRSSDD